MTRRHLPNRRSHEVLRFEHWSQTFLAGVGRATPDGPIQEVWINSGKSGTQAETLARDSAVLLSIALQCGVPITMMQRAVMRDLDGNPSGPIGRLVDLISEEQNDSAI